MQRNITIGSKRQLIDLNQDRVDFDLTISVQAKDQNSSFQGVVVTQIYPFDAQAAAMVDLSVIPFGLCRPLAAPITTRCSAYATSLRNCSIDRAVINGA